MSYPQERPRRLRANPTLRGMVAETRLHRAQLIQPLFVTAGDEIEPIGSLPGIDRWPLGRLPEYIERLAEAGVASVLLFGLPLRKDIEASGAWRVDGVVQQAARLWKKHAPAMQVIADTCLCEYTTHGHCGYLTPSGDVDNDSTLDLLARTAVSQAEAGCDIIAPSDMMDGRVGHLRAALDDAGFAETPILSYAAKYASAFYGPFREAADSAPAHGDRRGYQMDPANRREALREVLLDIDEGADMIMVKPAGPYLDIIREVREAIHVPLAAYQVSGEYAMLKAAAANGWLDERRAVHESLLGIARAGADLLLTYYTEELLGWGLVD